MIQCPVCMSQFEDSASACPVCGYKLLGKTEGFQRIDVETKASAPRSSLPTKAQLRIVRGPQVQTVHVINEDISTFGRNPSCSVFLNDMTVSRLHAAITKEQQGYCIEDKGSFNGTWVNNRLIEKAILRPGDIIQIGVFSMVFEIE